MDVSVTKEEHDIELNLKILKYVGLWPTNFTGYKRNYYLLYSCSIALSICLLVVTETAALFKYWGDLQKSTINSCAILVEISTIGKILVFLLMSRKHSDVVSIFKNNSQLEYRYAWIEHIKSKPLTIVYLFLGTLMCIIWGSVPLLNVYFLDYVKMKESNDTFVWELPNIALHPYDVNKTPSYEITYICQVIIGLLYSAATIGADTFYISLIIHTTAQLRILGELFMKCKNVENEKDVERRNKKLVVDKTGTKSACGKSFRYDGRLEGYAEEPRHSSCKVISPCCHDTGVERDANPTCITRCAQLAVLNSPAQDALSQCILHHTDLIRFVQSLEEVLRPSMLLQFVTSTMMICLSGFQATQPRIDLLSRFKFIVYLVIATFELFIYCWFCNELSEESIKLQISVFHSDWYEQSPHFRKSVSIVLEQTKRPIRFTAGKMFIINLDSFLKILNTSYSYLVVLRQLNESE